MVELSRNAERALAATRPHLRGLTHLVGALVAGPAALLAIASSPAGVPRFAVALYTLSATLMLALSAGMHWSQRDAHATEIWIRLDHSGIYLLVVAATTAVALLGLPLGWQRWIIPLATGIGLIGLIVEWVPRRTPKGFAHGMFLGGGWVMMVGVVPLGRGPGGPPAVAWLVAGGVVYTVGAILVALRKPDPWPDVFGYHEIWHLMVLVAVACHWHLVVGVLRPAWGAG